MEQSELRDLLFACLKAEWAVTTATELAHLTDAAWAELFTLANVQSISPMLWQRLQSYGQLVHVPPALAHRLQTVIYAVTVRNLRLYHELGLILAQLRQQKIAVIVLKGAHLAATVYPEPGLRSMNDLDLLFHPADVPAAVAVLRALGYEPAGPINWTMHLTTQHHLPRFGKPGVVAGIEVHWTITPPRQLYTIDSAELWARATPVTVAGVEVCGLCPEDLLLHICEHATYQHWLQHGVRPLCDIDAIGRYFAATLDWAQVVARAQQWGWTRGIYLALQLAQDLLATPIPPAVLAALQSDDALTRLVEATHGLRAGDATYSQRISYDFGQLWQEKQLHQKVRKMLQHIFLPRDLMASVYRISPHSPKLYLYYPLRIIDLLVRYSRVSYQLRRKGTAGRVIVQRRTRLVTWLEEST